MPVLRYNEVEMVGAARTGSLCRSVAVQPALDVSLADAVPNTIVVVDLDEGARVNARPLADSSGLKAGAPLAVVPYRSGDRHLVRAIAAKEAQ